jgi:hypothetical protein
MAKATPDVAILVDDRCVGHGDYTTAMLTEHDLIVCMLLETRDNISKTLGGAEVRVQLGTDSEGKPETQYSVDPRIDRERATSAVRYITRQASNAYEQASKGLHTYRADA